MTQPFGKESAKAVSEAIINIGKWKLDGLPLFVAKVYMNSEFPENHNIRTDDAFKSEYMFYYDGNKWNVEFKEILMETLLKNCIKMMKRELETGNLDPIIETNVKRSIESYSKRYESQTVSKLLDGCVKKIYKELYNSRQLVDHQQLSLVPT